MPTEMSTEELNSRLSLNIEEFLTQVIELADEYCNRNKLNPGNRLLILLYLCIAVTRELNTEIWKIGENYMKDMMSKLKEERA